MWYKPSILYFIFFRSSIQWANWGREHFIALFIVAISKLRLDVYTRETFAGILMG